MVQLSYPYMTTGKTIALIRRTFVGKIMSLLFNMLSRFVIAFLPRSKCLLISWLQSLSAVIFSYLLDSYWVPGIMLFIQPLFDAHCDPIIENAVMSIFSSSIPHHFHFIVERPESSLWGALKQCLPALLEPAGTKLTCPLCKRSWNSQLTHFISSG